MYLSIAKWRYHIGSLLGAIYSTFVFFFETSFYISILIPIIIVLLTAGRQTISKIILCTFAFMGCEIMIGGFIIALKNITHSVIRTGTALVFSMASIAVLASASYFVLQKLIVRRFKTPIIMATLEHNGKKRLLCLMIDSGNMARDYSTGNRIIFVSPSALGKFDLNTYSEYKTNIITASGSGTVVGFKPNKITFDDKKYNRENFILVSSESCEGLQGIDGIIPLIV